MTAALLYLLPALLILLPLLCGRYPGERLLRAISARPLRLAPAPPAPRRRFHLPVPLPRGGSLLASALAGRAPPAATAQ